MFILVNHLYILKPSIKSCLFHLSSNIHTYIHTYV